MKKLPIVAVVGRANTGKSSLFNAVLGERRAIVADQPGTTRDSVWAKISTQANNTSAESAQNEPTRQEFWLVDTAGMKAAEDEFELTIQEQITEAEAAADVIWVVIEAHTGITEEDRRVAKHALKTKKPVILVVNKHDKKPKSSAEDYQRLGIKDIVLTSTTQNRGVEEVVSRTTAIIPAASQREPDNILRVALLGRPNVGKSNLFNTMAKKQQAIVADVAGTTRDVNHARVKFHGQTVELLDTAGIRRSGKIGQGIERFSVIRSLAAIEQADVCLLLMDVNELNVQLDQKIAGIIKESGKGLILVVSKWDAAEEKDAFTRDQLAAEIKATYPFVPWAPLVFTSSVTGQNVAKIFEIAQEIAARRATRIPTNELNRWLRDVTNQHPPAGLKNRSPKLNYIIQETDNPSPNFKVFGAHSKFLHWSYKRYMERKFRETWDFAGTPVKFWFFEKHIDREKRKQPGYHRQSEDTDEE